MRVINKLRTSFVYNLVISQTENTLKNKYNSEIHLKSKALLHYNYYIKFGVTVQYIIKRKKMKNKYERIK